jgi:hypothetical protein
MESSFTIVIFVAMAVFILIGLLASLSRNNLYDQIGQGGLTMDDHGGGGGGGAGTPLEPLLDTPAARAQREREIRQMLQARSERLVRRGQPALDIDAELARLEGGDPATQTSGQDAGIAAEVRQLVGARNERRQRQGLEPLDVEAEVQRTMRELGA